MLYFGGLGGEACRAGGGFGEIEFLFPDGIYLSIIDCWNRAIGSLRSTRMTGDVLDPSCNRAADTAHDP